MIKKLSLSVSILLLLLFLASCAPSDTDEELPLEDEEAIMENENMRFIMSQSITGSKWLVTLRLENKSDIEKTLLFPTGQQFDVRVLDDNKDEVYRFSEGKVFTQVVIEEVVAPGDYLEWEHSTEVDQLAGADQVEAFLTATELNGEALDEYAFFLSQSFAGK
ncbi:BsuPI-related putative proteinase inhibitor [Texcoconibacillus texcoconensis]|uniref:Intracellular proteinase inhibitor BsuPI domain-containing protein n=1 Tax=Texcoconibacillus texcoconensis TaxID=1095777 RepID=A0A840QSR6_9BACI|nr:BsuPI-related putative proteinase inhibitor [Texcoconibacillus texcoconensis]MBB5174331.1 hypothetical protein [Texcoconibacillus texcoconensis]